MKPNTRLHTVASLYLTLVCPLLVFRPIMQALERWRTWEQIAWAAAVALGVWCWWSIRTAEKGE